MYSNVICGINLLIVLTFHCISIPIWQTNGVLSLTAIVPYKCNQLIVSFQLYTNHDRFSVEMETPNDY